MPEETAVAEPIQGLPRMQVITPSGNLFDDAGWTRTAPEQTKPADPPDGAPAEKPTDKPADKPADTGDEIVDELEYLEKQTGFKSWDEVKALKTEAEQLRSKAQTPAERKFANEESKRLAEAWEAGETDKVLDYLNTQRQLKKAADLPAADAIKLHLQQTNPHFKPEDIEDVFEERYSLPRKPVQNVGEEAEDFRDRMTEYNTRVAKVNRAIERDAFTAKQDLAQRITELKPPEIPKQQVQQGPTQEVLDARKAFVDNYRKELPKQLEEVKGFTTTFKDDSAEFPISFTVTAEELAPYKAELEEFANNGLDVNSLFSKRWINKDGSVNIQRVAEDLYLRDNRDKVFKKIATETGSKRMEAQRKINNNIKVDGETKVVNMDKTEKGTQAAAIDQLWKQA